MAETKAGKGPDHTLAGAELKTNGEEPAVYKVVDLHQYMKPEMDEELTSSQGTPVIVNAEAVCECVPVEDCVCNTVTYNNCGCLSTCSCDSQCHGALYWFPL